jgi:hypothetical protein
MLELYRRMDFSKFYNPELGHMRLGYSDADHQPSPYHYGLLCSEARVISVLAIANGQVPAAQWFKISRTLPAEWDWQSQKPEERSMAAEGEKYTLGTYTVRGVRLVPSWGGSMFEFLMPLLVVPEQTYAVRGLGENNRRAVQLQKSYCLDVKHYPVWGLSPCATHINQSYGYVETGCTDMGSKGYADAGWVTPYASFLALEIDPEGVRQNIAALQSRYPTIYTPYGFFDAVRMVDGHVVRRFLALDQAMILLALDNYLNAGAIRKRFFTDDMEKKVRPLLEQEKFF